MYATPIRAFLAAAALACGAFTTAIAQQAPPAQSQAPQAADVDDRSLLTFAKANARISEIGQQINERLQATQSEEDAQRIQTEGQQQMVEAVENTGLSVEEYNRIAQAIQADEALRQRYEELLAQG